MTNSIITATGSYLPPDVILNDQFLNSSFFSEDGNRLERSNPDIINKLAEITGIKERRHVTNGLTTSEIAHLAAEKALENVDPESLDHIIVAHNFGDVKAGSTHSDLVPSLASRVKHALRIKNPYTVAFDIPFGCPGWLQGVITADSFIKSGMAKRVLVIGSEIMSRVSDPHDIDSMIYGDGAGATLVEATDRDTGVLSHVARSDTYDNPSMLWMGRSYNPNYTENDLYLKMAGHEIYKYAVRTVPQVVRKNLDDTGFTLGDVNKILIHQANEKMDDAILKRLFKLYKVSEIPENVMPMIISWAGNSSVATLPIMFDLIMKGQLDNHRLNSGDIAVFASVGAGMNTNSMVYQMP
ncbi:MAG: ketoacyl-ACP synthase III [Deltaproteobacteria bacterium]|nr:ketoacyl-ACP synthase III [Deltaproteobacteria bacterium]